MGEIYHTIETPLSAAGAIAMIRVVHPDPLALGLPGVDLHQLKLSQFWRVDEGVITRFDDHSVLLMPHGGKAIVKALSDELHARGVPVNTEQTQTDAQMQASYTQRYPEAQSSIEAAMLSVISHATSPLAVDVLLQQPGRWSAVGVTDVEQADTLEHQANNHVLNRLIHPPVVAAIGRANIGKSTLLNTLVGEQVSIVADVVGTTRDHVGVHVNLGGLVARWIDMPGVDERVSESESQAIELAQRVLHNAQLIVHCIDYEDEQGELDQRLIDSMSREDGVSPEVLRLGMRSDLGPHQVQVDHRVSLSNDQQFEGVESLVSLIREQLFPEAVRLDSRPWKFWKA